MTPTTILTTVGMSERRSVKRWSVQDMKISQLIGRKPNEGHMLTLHRQRVFLSRKVHSIVRS